MSKLAHSDQRAMDKIEIERAVRDGMAARDSQKYYDAGWAAGYVDGINDKAILTDRLASYEAALREIAEVDYDESGAAIARSIAFKALEDNK